MKYSDKAVLKVLLGTTTKNEVKKYGFVTNFTMRVYFYCVLVSVSSDCVLVMAMQIQHVQHVLSSEVALSSNKHLF